MKYIDADLLRKEIERRLKYTHDWLRGCEKRHPNQTFISKNYYKMKGDERTLDALLNFLDTLPEEPDKSLEEEIDRFEDWMETYNQSDYPTSFTTRDIARHFAEWQKEQMLKDAIPFYEILKAVPSFERENTRIIIVNEEE